MGGVTDMNAIGISPTLQGTDALHYYILGHVYLLGGAVGRSGEHRNVGLVGMVT